MLVQAFIEKIKVYFSAKNGERSDTCPSPKSVARRLSDGTPIPVCYWWSSGGMRKSRDITLWIDVAGVLLVVLAGGVRHVMKHGVFPYKLSLIH